MNLNYWERFGNAGTKMPDIRTKIMHSTLHLWIDGTTTKNLWRMYPLLKVLATGIAPEEPFEFNIKRSEGDNARVNNVSISENERGYFEIIRMSRTLELLLGLNVLDNWTVSDGNGAGECFPVFKRSLPGLNLRAFTKREFTEPPLQQMRTLTRSPSLTKAGFWGNILKHYNIPSL